MRGTVNDVATSGAKVKYLSVAMVLEEGFSMDDLRRICETIREVAAEAGVHVVTGDTKVVNRGHGDGIYINTAGVGLVPAGVELLARTANRETLFCFPERWASRHLHHEPTREPLV